MAELITRRIYVASSWRNPDQPEVVAALRARGFEVYDFRNPPGRPGFAWSDIDPQWQSWTAEEYIAALEHPLAQAGYASDFGAMQWADTFVLVLPCGRSAHLELGWAAGAGKRTVVITRDGEEPELMAKMVDHIAVGIDDALDYLRAVLAEPERRAPVQGDRRRYGTGPGGPAGTISWAEHEEAWQAYHRRYSNDQDAETIARRGGFGYWELCDQLGHKPATWREVSRG